MGEREDFRDTVYRWFTQQRWHHTRLDPHPGPWVREHYPQEEHSMGLTVTSDQATYPQGARAVVTVVRDPNAEDTIVDYPITFQEVSGGAVVDSGDITLEVVIPAGQATTIVPVDASGTLSFDQLSDDGTTAVFGVTLPSGDPVMSPAADPVAEVETATPAPGQVTRTASGARQVTG